MRICKATLANAKTLNSLSTRAFLPAHGHSAPQKDIDNYITVNFSEENFIKELSNPKNEYHLIYYKDKPVGFSKIVFNLQNEYLDATNVTYMSRLYLLKEYYGFNLGKELFDFNVSLSKKNNQQGIWLAVWVENSRAISFYKKMGFNIIGSYDFKISETHSNPNHIMYLHY
ncbi:MAG: GNAT family N-acetyltransferase [Flavobacteriaceae bacterium]